MRKKITGIWVLFALFFLFLYIQHQFVYMYFDDYGYASLSYGYTGNMAGMSYSLMDVLRFIKWHYLEWGGRVFYYCLGILSMRVGLWCVRLVQCLFLLGSTVYSWRLTEAKEDLRGNYIKAFILVFLYGAIGIETFREGIFWFSAAMGYVWPLCTLFAAIYYQKQYHKTEKSGSLVLAGILFFAASFSYEQVALMTATYTILCYVFGRFRKEKRVKGEIFLIFSAILGSGIEILAPGNFVRASDEANEAFFALSFSKKLSVNIPRVLEINLGYDNWISVLVFLLSGFMCAWGILREKKGSFIRSLNLWTGVILSAAVVVSWKLETEWYVCCVLILWILWYTINITLSLWNKRNWMVALFYGGICSQGMMLLSPTIPARAHIPFLFVMNMMAAYVVSELFTRFLSRGMYLFLGMLAAAASLNIASITMGYWKNAEINDINHCKLMEKSFRIRAGMKVPSIVLYRMRDDSYAARMPYHEPAMEYWMKNYYELPQSVHFIWDTLEAYSEVNEIAVSNRPKIVVVYPGDEDRILPYNEDGSLDIGITPEILKDSLRIWIDGEAVETVVGDGYVSTRVPREKLKGDLHIWLVDEDTSKASDEILVKMDR
ncbi:MAG TPA: hypothetical protein DCZ91_14440 [Lachnospiraceae bacterium]|nr:hypothetical protein [Lachnospiraceae bacterium]